jgi:phenylacetate-CoA ligase
MSDLFPDVLDPIETESRAFLDRYQAGALTAICEHAYTNAPLIKQAWDKVGVKPSDIKSIKDFVAKAPIIDKDDVRLFRDAHNDPAGGMGRNIPGETVSIGTTSGTTGDPTPVPNWVSGGSELAYARDMYHIGARPGDYITHMLFTFRGGHRRRGNANTGITEICYAISPDEVARAVEGSLRFRPTVWYICSTPVLLMLEQYFENHPEIDPIDVFSSYKGAIFGGEPLSDRLQKLTESWGFPMFETTSLGEVAGTTECREHNGFHAYEDIAFIETVDPVTRTPIADGEIGELVTTTLIDRLTPLVRYGTGDLAVIDRSPCPCGKNHARFKVLGRTTDQILVQGRSILPREIMGLIDGQSETRASLFQIIRTDREMETLKLRIGYDVGRVVDSLEALQQRLHGLIATAIGVPVHIELIDEQELLKLGPPHKIPRVTKS